ncbi:MBL fold metallo-hydrolase [Pararhizobium qamdonense]|uniref:MBL fold metallo-hydrolase n=1 Tax=Pararhizobium qamdonense TaxID=3031126 RepID=UPI0023E2004D|nr:MBL fold metallo-hydrolase [Pararhizobium qamdonense]
MNRREHLKLAGLAALAVTLPPGGVFAQAPVQTRLVNPGVYRYRVGDFTVTAIQDGGISRPVEGLVTNAGLDAVQMALSEAFQPEDRFPITFTALVVDTGRHLVVIDTGAAGFFGANAGRLPQGFAAAGIDPAKVDTVLISHLHPDHVSGLRTASGQLLFANATIHAPEGELNYWLDEATAGRAPEPAKPFFQNAMRVLGPVSASIVRLSGEREIVPGITAIPAHGHAPGHTVFQITSGSEGLMVLGDVANNPALFVRYPDWRPAFDMDREMAAGTRKRLLDRIAADRLHVAGYHFPFPAHGHIRRDGTGFAYVPAPRVPHDG